MDPMIITDAQAQRWLAMSRVRPGGRGIVLTLTATYKWDKHACWYARVEDVEPPGVAPMAYGGISPSTDRALRLGIRLGIVVMVLLLLAWTWPFWVGLVVLLLVAGPSKDLWIVASVVIGLPALIWNLYHRL